MLKCFGFFKAGVPKSSKGLTLQTVSLDLSFPLFYLFIVMYYTEIAASTVSEILVITELIVGGKGTCAQRTLLLDLFVFRIQAPSE